MTHKKNTSTILSYRQKTYGGDFTYYIDAHLLFYPLAAESLFRLTVLLTRLSPEERIIFQNVRS